LERIPEEISVKKMFKNISEGKRSFGKSGKRWLGYVENDLNEMAGQNSYL